MACSDCLRRGVLLQELAPNIDRAVDNAAGRRAREILALDDVDLAEAVSSDAAAADRALGGSAARAASGEFAERLERAGCWVLCRHQPGWPRAFERLGDAAPRALYGRGERDLLPADAGPRAVTIVGARRASPYGREIAHALAGELAAVGLIVISGLAFGVDTAAHRGALATGSTVAVLGAGAERAYPRSAASVYRSICERGLVVSELPPGSSTFRWGFPARNRLMAALAEMTIVVEAAERSGSLITAEMAADAGRLVGAVPGPVNSWRSGGTNKLLLDGAGLIREAADVLDHLLGPGAGEAAAPPPPAPELDADEQRVLDAVEAGAATIDELVKASGLGFGAVTAALTELESGGHVVAGADGGYSRGGGPRHTMRR